MQEACGGLGWNMLKYQSGAVTAIMVLASSFIGRAAYKIGMSLISSSAYLWSVNRGKFLLLASV